MQARHDFDLILLDLQILAWTIRGDGQPELDSPDEYLRVLVLTAQPSLKLRALQAGARDFVTKPFDIVEIQARIRNMLEVRILYRRVADQNLRLEQAVQERTAELRESEARFRSLVELASDWYWEQDETGEFTRVSGPALEMLGLDARDNGNETAGSNWNRPQLAQLGEKVASRRPFLDFVYSRIAADGSVQFLQASGEPKFDETGRFTGYRGIGMDVTARMGNNLST